MKEAEINDLKPVIYEVDTGVINMQGAEDQGINSDLIRKLNRAEKVAWELPPYFGISTTLELEEDQYPNLSETGKKWLRKLRELSPKVFSDTTQKGNSSDKKLVLNDGINPTEGALGLREDDYLTGGSDWNRDNLRLTGIYLSKDPITHHINYMRRSEIIQVIEYFLTGKEKETGNLINKDQLQESTPPSPTSPNPIEP